MKKIFKILTDNLFENFFGGLAIASLSPFIISGPILLLMKLIGINVHKDILFHAIVALIVFIGFFIYAVWSTQDRKKHPGDLKYVVETNERNYPEYPDYPDC